MRLLALLPVLLVLLLPASAAAAAPGCSRSAAGAPEGTAYYMREYHVSRDEAIRRLDVQDRAGWIADEIRGSLGDHFAGDWFDNEATGRYVVGYTAGADLSHARRVVTECRLDADVSFVELAWSWSELKASQAALGDRLEALGIGDRWSTGLGVVGGRYVIKVEVAARRLGPEDSRAIDAAIAATPVGVVRIDRDEVTLAAIPTARSNPLQRLWADGQGLGPAFACAIRTPSGSLRLLITRRHALRRAHRLAATFGAGVRLTAPRYGFPAMRRIALRAYHRLGQDALDMESSRGRTRCPRLILRPERRRHAAARALARRYGNDRVVVRPS